MDKSYSGKGIAYFRTVTTVSTVPRLRNRLRRLALFLVDVYRRTIRKHLAIGAVEGLQIHLSYADAKPHGYQGTQKLTARALQLSPELRETVIIVLNRNHNLNLET